MLADNILLLKEKYPELYQKVCDRENQSQKTEFSIEQAKDGHEILKYKSFEKTIYMNSKYNPVHESELIIDQMIENEDITKDTHIIFYGIGLGYHIEYFKKQFPNVTFSIMEPSVEIFSLYLDKKPFKNLLSKRLVSIQCGDNTRLFFHEMNQSKEKRFVIYELPAYVKIFKCEYLEFLDDFKRFIKEQRRSINVNYSFKKRWVINSVNNLKEVLATPNILMENKGAFKEKTAILVAAGPSLNYEIENLRRIKEEERAYIFTVGSAINTLVHHNIHPHAMCTYDPTEMNQVVFKKINDLSISTIPMIFGSSVGYETLEQYDGPKYHMITSQDTIANCLLKPERNETLEKVNDAPSIAVVTLELLAKLGFKQIILVGQNLAYLNNMSYAEGIEYNQNEENPLSKEDRLIVKDVDGNDVYSNDTYMSMKKMIEMIIKHYNITVYNTTIGGAEIVGAPFKKMQDLIKVTLPSENVNNEIFQKIENKHIYDREFMYNRLSKLQLEFENYKNILIQIRKYHNKLKKALTLINSKKINEIHIMMDQWIERVENNLFFTTIVQPLNRVEYGLLANIAISAKMEKGNLAKARKILEPTEDFVNTLFCEMELNEEIMISLKDTIENYIGEKND